MTIYSRISGTGSYLPPRRLTNADLVAELAVQGIESSDEWIVERTGIRARHFVQAGVGSSDLGAEAAKRAIQAAGCQASDIDLIIVATSTPDMVFPSTAALLQNKLGIVGCPVFDVQAVCSGFIYAMTVADAMIKTGTAKRALVIGAEVFSRILDFKDRTTCVLFGDGAGAGSGGLQHPWYFGHRYSRRWQICRHSLRARSCFRRCYFGRSRVENGWTGSL